MYSPGWMHETSARAWCTGKTQRDWVEKEVFFLLNVRIKDHIFKVCSIK